MQTFTNREAFMKIDLDLEITEEKIKELLINCKALRSQKGLMDKSDEYVVRSALQRYQRFLSRTLKKRSLKNE